MDPRITRSAASKEPQLGSGRGGGEGRMTVDMNAPLREMDEVVENSDERALERAPLDSEGAQNGEPCIGMEFDSEDAVKAFYYDYAMRVGFSVRSNLRRRSMRDGSTIALEFVCSKEGFRREKHPSKRAETRNGCKAMIKVRKAESGKWAVTRFLKEHNHELETPRKLPLLRARRRISNAVKNPNYTPSLRKRTLGRDSQYLLDYFKRMQVKNPSFFYAVHLDDEYRMTNFFWIDARSRMAYNYFGDVVIFDTTYKTNRYGMPFAPFLGANHHKQPISFGCALLLDESETSLVWLFSTWLEAMSGRYPISIVAEHDPAIGAAIAKVFPKTNYRFCKRHIIREFHDRLGHVDSEHKDFIKDFFQCINMTELNDEFDSRWWSFIDKYGLKDNEWLQSLYKTREQWVQVYLQDTFIANISVDQLSENINSFFGGYLKIHTPLQEFIEQLEKIINSQHEKELEDDSKTRDTKPLSKTGLPMESQVAEIYTTAIFLEFQEQLFQSLRHIADIIKEDGPIITFRVAEFGVGKTVYAVTFDVMDVKASCSCQMFEYAGIPCRHILRVFSVKNIMLLPSNYILKRWTRNATIRVVPDDHNIEIQGGCQESRSLRYDDLCRQAVKYASEGATTSNIYNVAMRALRKAFEEVVASKKDDWMVGQPSSLINFGAHQDSICEGSLPDNTAGHAALLDPRRRVTRGHPTTRFLLENQRLHGGIAGELGFPDRILRGVPTNSAMDLYEPSGIFTLEHDNFPQVAHGTSFRDRDSFPQ
ncbi:hypothetical protein AAC387_Pa03g3588 [Persea americana]